MSPYVAISVLLLVCSSQWTQVMSNSDGAPIEACDSLSPESSGHGVDVQPLPSIPVFGFNLSAVLSDGNGGLAYLPGFTYPLPFSGSGLPFLGVLFQARTLADDSPTGSFANVAFDSDLQVAPCPGQTAATHTNADVKTEVTAAWTAPPVGTGAVELAYSVVLDLAIFASNQRSMMIAEAALPSTDSPPATASPATTAPPTTGGMGMGGDPHFSVKLPSQKQLCYSIQGKQGLHFNLISNKQVQMNALFVADSVREEVTWIGGLGMVIKNSQYKDSKMTTIRFDAAEKTILIGNDVNLKAQNIGQLTFENGKLTISEADRGYNCSCFGVQIELMDVGLNFSIHFIKNNHLDMIWNNVEYLDKDSHGLIGQFFRRGVDIDSTRKLLLIPGMEPVPVMRKPIWHFMERDHEEDLLCWVAMNPGYQGKRLIQGTYMDYVVDDLLSTKFSMH